MAAKLSSGGGGKYQIEANSEINVTPFVDVMLVLLIIFMVAAPLATVDVNVDLPVSNATPAQRPDQPVYVTVKPDLTLALGNTDIAPGGHAAALAEATEGDREQRIFLRADREVAYGDLMEVMNRLRDAGDSVILVSHDLDEAMRIGDRIAIMDHANVIALDTPAGLKSAVGGDVEAARGGVGGVRAQSRLDERQAEQRREQHREPCRYRRRWSGGIRRSPSHRPGWCC